MKIRQNHCKKGLKTRKGPEFDSDLWENNNDIALQSREVFSRCLYGGTGGGYKLDPTIQTSLKFESVSWLTSNLSFSNLASLLILRRCFVQC